MPPRAQRVISRSETRLQMQMIMAGRGTGGGLAVDESVLRRIINTNSSYFQWSSHVWGCSRCRHGARFPWLLPASAQGHIGLHDQGAGIACSHIRTFLQAGMQGRLGGTRVSARPQKLVMPRRSGLISCRIVVAISSMDLVVVDSQRTPARRIMASASETS